VFLKGSTKRPTFEELTYSNMLTLNALVEKGVLSKPEIPERVKKL
jgi:hypothetical protein